MAPYIFFVFELVNLRKHKERPFFFLLVPLFIIPRKCSNTSPNGISLPPPSEFHRNLVPRTKRAAHSTATATAASGHVHHTL